MWCPGWCNGAVILVSRDCEKALAICRDGNNSASVARRIRVLRRVSERFDANCSMGKAHDVPCPLEVYGELQRALIKSSITGRRRGKQNGDNFAPILRKKTALLGVIHPPLKSYDLRYVFDSKKGHDDKVALQGFIVAQPA